MRDVDAAVHTASAGDQTGADVDSAVVDAAIEAFGGTGKPYIGVSGLWIYGDNQHWSTVHVADLAHFFVRALEDETARGRYLIGDGANPTVAQLTEAAAVAAGAPGVVPGSNEEARARFGDYFAEVLLLDQATYAAKARDQLGWAPRHPNLTDEFRHGSYNKVTTA